MSGVVNDALRPSAKDALAAWAARVRANREQVDQFREASPSDFYAPIAGMFRADPRRQDEPALQALRALVRPQDTVLDIGAGAGRYALPLALQTREVIAIDPSEGMLHVLRGAMREHGIANVRIIAGRWPTPLQGRAAGAHGAPEDAAGTGLAAGEDLSADVALISHLGYDVEDIGPFLDAMENAAGRVCVAILLEQPPPTEADRLWPAIHGVERAALPSLPEFITLLLARGKLPEVQLVYRLPQSYDQPDQALAWLRGQLWTAANGAKDQKLQALLRERIQERQGRYAMSWAPVRMGVVTWHA